MVDVRANNAAYQAFKDNLNASGIRTTNTNAEKEADFGDYGAALSDDLKQQILNSFDCEQDYELQKQIAGLYTNKSVLQSKEFMNACKGMGLNVSVQYQKTSYISDYKAGNFSNSVGGGSIAVYTISDGMGGEIKIADANGNGALESEEIFMNQILGDINTEIGAIAPAVNTSITGSSGGGASSSDSGSYNGYDNYFMDSPFEFEQQVNVSQDAFNKEVEKFLDQGFERSVAVMKASEALGVTMLYTGDIPTVLV